MGKRGPKPVDLAALQSDTFAWAVLLYTLRDGKPGYMQNVKWGPWRNTGPAKWTRVQSGPGMLILPKRTRYRSHTPLGPRIVITVSDAARTLPGTIEANDWLIVRPVMPEPQIWSMLKRAHSEAGVRQASRKLRDWIISEFGEGVGRWLPGNPPAEFADVLEQYAAEFLEGKRLPSYAKTDRPSSDDKRLVLMSKILAGARAGLAPITAAKRLSHWHYPRGVTEKALQEYVKESQLQVAAVAAESKNTVIEPLP